MNEKIDFYSQYNDIYDLHNKTGADTLFLLSDLTKSIEKSDTFMQLATLFRMSDFYKKNSLFKDLINTERIFINLAEKTGNIYLQAASMNRLADGYLIIGLADEAAGFYYTVMKSLLKINPDDSIALVEKAKAQFGVSTIYAHLKCNTKAERYLNEAYKTLIKLDNNDELLSQILLWQGVVMQNRGDHDSARYYFNESLDLSIKQNSRSGMGEAFYNFGSLELIRNNTEEAEINLINAYNTLKSTSDRVNKIKTCALLGDVYLQTNQYDQSEKYYKEGMIFAEEMELNYYLEIFYRRLSDLYGVQNNSKLTAVYHEKALEVSDVQNKTKIQTNLMLAEMNYETEKNAQIYDTLKTKYEIRSKVQGIIIVSSVLIIFLLILIFAFHYRYVKVKRDRNISLIRTAKMKSDFYKQLTDDFRTPLTIIGGLAEKLKENLTDGGSTHNLIDLDVIEKQSRNLVFLLNEVLTISNLKSKENIDWVYGNIVHFLQFLHSGYMEVAESKSVDYFFHSSSEGIEMDYSKENIRLVINNIIGFLFKQSVKGDKITMLIREDEKNKKCYIELTGNRNSLLEISDDAGFGDRQNFDEPEGLRKNDYILFSKQIVRNMGGKFTLQYNSPAKTSFLIELPVKNNHRFNSDCLLSYTKTSSGAAVIKDLFSDQPLTNVEHKPGILIVEDNSYMFFYLSSLLKGNYNLWKAEDGEKAIKVAGEKIPDLIITDNMIPQISGTELSIMLKNNYETSHIPIVMITSKSSLKERVLAYKSGVDVVLPKPFDEEELMVIIENLLITRNVLRNKFANIVPETGRESKKDLVESNDLIFLQRITDIIYREIQSTDFFPERLADEMNISTTHLNRRIKALTGMNTMTFVNNIKLNKAKKLLVSSQRPIGDVASECGFNDFSYFSRSFKKEFGLTPSQFQKMAVKN